MDLSSLGIALPPWAQLAIVVALAVSEVLGSTPRVAPNSVLGLAAAIVRRAGKAMGRAPKATPPEAG